MPRAFGIHSNFTTMRRRSVQQDLPLYSGPTIGPDYDLQKKQRSSGNAGRLWLLLLFLGTTMLLWYWKRSTKPTSLYGRDVHENCENWARRVVEEIVETIDHSCWQTAPTRVIASAEHRWTH